MSDADFADWEDPQWTDDLAARRVAFAEKIAFLLAYVAGGLPE